MRKPVKYKLGWRREHYDYAQSRVYQNRPNVLRRVRSLLVKERTEAGGRLLWVALEKRPVGTWEPTTLVGLDRHLDDYEVPLREPNRRVLISTPPPPGRTR